MNRFFTLLFAASCLTAVGQVEMQLTYLSSESHAPRSTEMSFSGGNGLIDYTPLEWGVASCGSCESSSSTEFNAPFPFGFATNCIDDGWIFPVNGYLRFYLESVPNSMSIHTSWTGCCRDAEIEIAFWQGSFWQPIDTVQFLGQGCGWQHFAIETSHWLLGCTQQDACNFDVNATVDDGTCLFAPSETLQTMVELSSSNELQVSVPQGLSSWSWSDEVQDSTRTIQPFQEYVLNGFVGEIPEIGEEFEGGVVFAIDTMAKTAFVATSEPVGPGSEWGCKTTTTGATSTAFGAGQTNTQIILDACQDSDCAARIAASVGPDWYLPSRDELEAIRVRLHNDGLASYYMNNTHNWYWSSTECLTDGTAATDIHFSDGFVGECNNKDSNPGGVIAVKNSPINFCSYTDTLRIELDGDPLCGIGTVWDDISQTCIVANPADINLDGCVQLNDLLDLLSAYGDCGAEEAPWQCGDPLEYQGYDYETVQIGSQCWFAENLRYLPAVSPPTSGSESDNQPHAYVPQYYGDSVLEAMGHSNFASFGVLYNFLAVEQWSLCPQGWHVPEPVEWNLLVAYTGGSNAGYQLKNSPDDIPTWNGSNAFGFNATPSGVRDQPSSFSLLGSRATFWANKANGAELAWGRYIHGDGVNEFSNAHKSSGMSVRCIQDAE
jgi:uncharacterized protein (TIGR02145 family)